MPSTVHVLDAGWLHLGRMARLFDSRFHFMGSQAIGSYTVDVTHTRVERDTKCDNNNKKDTFNADKRRYGKPADQMTRLCMPSSIFNWGICTTVVRFVCDPRGICRPLA